MIHPQRIQLVYIFKLLDFLPPIISNITQKLKSIMKVINEDNILKNNFTSRK